MVYVHKLIALPIITSLRDASDIQKVNINNNYCNYIINS